MFRVIARQADSDLEHFEPFRSKIKASDVARKRSMFWGTRTYVELIQIENEEILEVWRRGRQIALVDYNL